MDISDTVEGWTKRFVAANPTVGLTGMFSVSNREENNYIQVGVLEEFVGSVSCRLVAIAWHAQYSAPRGAIHDTEWLRSSLWVDSKGPLALTLNGG